MATINGTSVGGMTLQIDYSYTQNTTANTSTVTAKLQLVNHYALYATALSGSYISVGGSRTDYSTSVSYGGSTTTTTVLATKTVTVSHNSDGTGTCNLSGAFVMNGTYRGYSVGTMTVSSTITLTTIPRASGLTVPTSINTGAALSGTVSPSSSSFNHKVELKIGSAVKQTITLATGTNTFSATIPHSWFPSSTSGTISVVLSAYSGTTFIASTTKNVTANVPASVVPSISALTAASSVTSGTFANLYVQGKTTVKLTATATAGDGSSIASYTYSGSGINTTVATNTATTSTLQVSGAQTYTVSVKDARGRTASKTVSITVYPYAAPSIGPVSVQRCDVNGNLTESGTYAKYTVNSAYSPVNSKNTRTVTVAYSSNNGSTYSAETTLQATTDTASTKTGVYGGGAFAIASAYILRFTIKDAYGATKTITAPLQSASRPINIRSNGKGVSIGAMSTKDAFECSFDADFNKNVNIDGALTTVGKINGVDIGTDTYVVGGSRDNITDENWISSAPSFIGTYSQNDQWYNTISCRHRNGQSDGANYGLQLRSILTKADNLSWRQNMNGSWDGWKTILDSNNTADYVVGQGTSGIWTYRKWNSGLAECWGIYTMTSACTKAWGALYYSDTLAPRINYPFTFTSRPQETVFCRGDSVSAWAYPEGGGIGMNTTTQTAQYGFLRPTTMTAAQVRYEYTVVGKWK